MRLLVIDTALGACTVALFEDGQPLAVRSEPMIKGHQERLGGFARDVVGQDFSALDRIGVTVGPGSFTGLRVGLAFAQGLGSALDRPVVGISTLAALNRSVGGAGRATALIDARRGQVYLQSFIDRAPAGDAEALSLDDAAARIGLHAKGDPVRLIGSGGPLLADQLPDAQINPLAFPSAEALAVLTMEAEPAALTGFPRPIYLRAPDAAVPTRLPGQPRT